MSSPYTQPARWTPQRLFRTVAVAEAITWTLLLIGMVLKYVTDTTELGVRIGGMLHGVVFIAYCLTTIVVGVDERWKVRRIVLGLASSIPPFFTIWFDLAAEAKGWFTGSWRLATQAPRTVVEKVVSWLIRKPGQGLIAAIVAVAVLTCIALLVGPPASS
ncbi:DUF3817 domain-containing protein [Nocardioides sp.]|uniref:DUF3817 domain-containing protein n=1 Tax=Nocardioides sp. TaxID=35761 RepID=UPI0026309659|nr:DUF3817 domain-containing protein [Nocardioides sp.]